MIGVLISAFLLSQANAIPSPAPTLGPAWTPAAHTEKDQYARYVRKEADGTQSAIQASRQVCDCDPGHAVEMIQTVFKQVPDAAVVAGVAMVCGVQARRIIVTGHAGPSNPDANNLEILEFRVEPALYSLTYTFKSKAPVPEDEAALLTLCPKSP